MLLTMFLNTPNTLLVFTLFSAQEVLMILEKTSEENSCIIVLSYFMLLEEKCRQFMKLSTHELLN